MMLGGKKHEESPLRMKTNSYRDQPKSPGKPEERSGSWCNCKGGAAPSVREQSPCRCQAGHHRTLILQTFSGKFPDSSQILQLLVLAHFYYAETPLYESHLFKCLLTNDCGRDTSQIRSQGLPVPSQFYSEVRYVQKKLFSN